MSVCFVTLFANVKFYSLMLSPENNYTLLQQRNKKGFRIHDIPEIVSFFLTEEKTLHSIKKNSQIINFLHNICFRKFCLPI